MPGGRDGLEARSIACGAGEALNTAGSGCEGTGVRKLGAGGWKPSVIVGDDGIGSGWM
jgi:hypothetical protein